MEDLLPHVVRVDDCTDANDVLDMMVLGEFVAGRLPCSLFADVRRVRDGATLLPPGVEPIRVADGPRLRTVVAEGPGWLLCANRWRDGDANVHVVASSDALAAEVVAAATAGAEEPEVEGDRRVCFTFWHARGDGKARAVDRRLDVPTWADIRRNYAGSAATALDVLMGLGPDDLNGRLLLLHGPSGTGKTTALRALADAWRPWCRAEVVIDPERLYADPGYLSAVLLGDEDDEERWRLLVLEDCDELLRADAKQATGQVLARLLNVADGLLGQGLKLLVALTTNERIGELHAAVTRPGRCLAEVHVGPLPATEAAAWLGGPVPGGATLAELCDRKRAGKVTARPKAAGTGQYL